MVFAPSRDKVHMPVDRYVVLCFPSPPQIFASYVVLHHVQFFQHCTWLLICVLHPAHGQRHPLANHTPILIYIHYKSRISCTTHGLLDMSIQSPTPLQGNLIPHNAFISVVGPVCIRNIGECSVLNADHMEIIPANAGPPLTTNESLFAQFPASNIDAVGILADGSYRMPDQTYILPITISQFVCSGIHYFCIAFIILTNC